MTFTSPCPVPAARASFPTTGATVQDSVAHQRDTTVGVGMESGFGLRRPARHQRGFDTFQVISQTPDALCLGHDGPRGHQPV